ncbi:MAG TPA: transglycosylase SLT domain-containing protein [Pyrinomonadaceae bacterium]|nr:transglycosylase SLT domain-containing protein [Pyrinomonadaceae bacterium]
MNSFVLTITILALGNVGTFNQLSTVPNFAVHFFSATAAQAASDTRLAEVRREDRNARNARGVMTRLSAEEHMRRASIYHTNRAFAEAREHWQALINYYPEDPRVPEAVFGIGRSHFQSRNYNEAFQNYDQLARNFSSTKEGREGLNFSAAALLRMGRTSEAADRYLEYINRFPSGERIETAHLNAIDTLREAGRNREAAEWASRTRQRFAGTPTETNAVFGQLRLDISQGNWRQAVSTADDLLRRSFPRSVGTSSAEVTYLKGYSLERAGRKDEAIITYLSIPGGIKSYYGWLATDRLSGLVDSDRRVAVNQRLSRLSNEARDVSDQYPAPYRPTILSASKKRGIDPRFILAIIRQESVFKPMAKSPAGARGLLQLTIDAAHKYAPGAGINSLNESQLYQPDTSILVGSEYLRELYSMFPNMHEAVAASYNGGEDNVARWVKRAKHNDAGVFTSEVGFDETKNYVQKVLNNYRVYQQLYNQDLTRR